MLTAAEMFATACRHYQSGRRDLAIEWLERALHVDANVPEIHSNLGVALAQEGRLAEAVIRFREAARLRPDFAQAHCNLGTALRDSGQLCEAEASFREAVRLQPSFVEAHHNLGGLLAQTGRAAEAVASLQTAVRLAPNYADAQHSLGTVLRSQGRLEEATIHLQQAARLRPDHARGHSDLGVVYAEQGRLPEAVASFEQAVRLRPDSPDTRNNLGNALREQARLDEAAVHLREALRLNPDYALAHNNLGLVVRDQNRLEEARSSFHRAVELKPDYASAHANLGTVLETLGELDAAADCYREALRHDARHAGALAQLTTMLRRRLSDADFSRIEQLADDPLLPEGERCRLLFACCHVLDARGDYAGAAARAQQANAIESSRWRKRGQGFDPAAFARFVERLEQTFSPEFFPRVRGWGSASERPVFIFGLPRSGTTLTEQIVASHSQVYGGGELHFAEHDFEALAQIAGVAALPSTAATQLARPRLQREQILEALSRLDPQAVERLARQHLDWLEALNGTASRITSKTPANWQFVGLLAVLFPRARFIHCRRDLRDVAVSCWMTHFQHLSWTCEQEHLAARFQAYQRLTDHWRGCLPVPILEIDYEETVGDLEGTARRLISWLGLDWEPACLNFHETRRAVRTASAVQVRQPLYQSSVGRWRHYAEALAPLFSKLPVVRRT